MNGSEGNCLVIRLGTDDDKRDIAKLRLHERTSHLAWSISKRALCEDDATLVMRVPSGEMVASLVMGIVRTPEELEGQVGSSIQLGSGDFPVLTTTNICSLDDGLYLDILRYFVIRTAQNTTIDGRSFAWQIGIEHAARLGDWQRLGNMGCQIRPGNLLESMVTVSLPRAYFEVAYRTWFNAPMYKELPRFEYRGRLPFQDRH